MSMQQNGLAKLVEECGEVMQVAGKMIQYPELQPITNVNKHPDGTVLRDKLEEEIADVAASLRFVADKLKLSKVKISKRLAEKLKLFEQWDKE